MSAVTRVDPVAFHASRRGDKLACIDLESGRSWSYSELNRDVNAAAGWLTAQLGPASGARVATLARNRVFLLILHLAYAFVPIGFVLLGLSSLGLISPSAGIHAWTGGTVGTMTLAVMTRASLGHTGHALTASIWTQAIYAAVLVAAVSRICAALEPQWSNSLLHLAAFTWAAAFLGFGAVYGPILLRPRRA